jgi:hypothetical protein
MTVIKIVPMPGPQGQPGGGGSADIADFVFNYNAGDEASTMSIANHDMVIETTRTEGQDADIDINSADDVWIYANGDDIHLYAADNVEITTNYNGEGDSHNWEFNNSGQLMFPGFGLIENQSDSSGDGLGYSTFKIVPDNNLETDQYLIIDPTGPNHIHIRAGGTQDDSNALLILGGEKNNVSINDSVREVIISTRPPTVSNNYVNDNLTSSTTFLTSTSSDIGIDYVVNVGGTDYVVDAVTSNFPTEGLLSVTASGAVFVAGNTYTFTYEQPYTNDWQFNSNGYLTGPAMGSLFVNGLLNGESDLWLGSNHSVVLSSGDGSAFLDDPTNENNIIATVGNIAAAFSGGATGSFVSQDGKTITVTGGLITNIEVNP